VTQVRASTSTLIETRRGPAIQVEAENEQEVVIRIAGRLANTSISLHVDEALAVSSAISASVAVVEAGVR
jgi:hypothetical protein